MKSIMKKLFAKQVIYDSMIQPPWPGTRPVGPDGENV